MIGASAMLHAGAGSRTGGRRRVNGSAPRPNGTSTSHARAPDPLHRHHLLDFRANWLELIGRQDAHVPRLAIHLLGLEFKVHLDRLVIDAPE